MVFIKIEGADQIIAMEFTTSVQKTLAKKLDVDEKNIVFICPETFLVHQGQEQTSFQVLVEVLLPTLYKDKEKDVAALLSKKLTNIAIHSHIIFTYFDHSHEYDEINPDYPLYMDGANTVKVAAEETVEVGGQTAPYMGNIFAELDDFIASHPEMNQEQATFEYYKLQEKNK